MRHIDECCIDSLAEFNDFRAHLVPQFGIKVGKRFVHQEYLGFANNSTPNRDTLALATRESLWFTFQEICDTEYLSSLIDLPVNLSFLFLAQLKRKREVLINCHVRIKRIVLENHCDIPVFGRNGVDESVINVEFTFRDLLKTCDHSERGRFSAA